MQSSCLRWIEKQLEGNKFDVTWERFLQLAACKADRYDRDCFSVNIYRVLVLFLEKLAGDQPIQLGMLLQLMNTTQCSLLTCHYAKFQIMHRDNNVFDNCPCFEVRVNTLVVHQKAAYIKQMRLCHGVRGSLQVQM